MALPITANLVFHLDANTLSGSSDGTQISLWTDGSGNGYDAHQATSTNQPILFNSFINGQSVVSFDGIDNYMIAVGFSAELQNTAFDMFVVAFDNEDTLGTFLVSWNLASDTDTPVRLSIRDSGESNGNSFDFSNRTGGAQELIESTVIGGNVALLNPRYDGNGTNGGTNGTTSFIVNGNGATSGTLSVNRSHTDNDNFVLGALQRDSSGDTNHLSGYIADIAIYSV